MSSSIVARLLRWERPGVNRPGYTPGHVELPIGRVVTRPGPGGKPIPVGTVVATRDTPTGLEATIRLRDDDEGSEVAAEVADGYRPAVDVTLQPLTSDPATFRPRARVATIALSTIADPTGDQGRILSIDGTPLTPSDQAPTPPVRPVKPRTVTDAEELLTAAGYGSSWWAAARART